MNNFSYQKLVDEYMSNFTSGSLELDNVRRIAFLSGLKKGIEQLNLIRFSITSAGDYEFSVSDDEIKLRRIR